MKNARRRCSQLAIVSAVLIATVTGMPGLAFADQSDVAAVLPQAKVLTNFTTDESVASLTVESVDADTQLNANGFRCSPKGGGGFEGTVDDGDWDMYVSGQCTIKADEIRAHGSLTAVSGPASGEGTSYGKTCTSTVVCGDSDTFACAPCAGTWAHRAIVYFYMPPNAYFTGTTGSCYIVSSHEAYCDNTAYATIG